MDTLTRIDLQSDNLKYEFTLADINIIAPALRAARDSELTNFDEYEIAPRKQTYSYWMGYVDSLSNNTNNPKMSWFMQESTRRILCSALNGFERNSPNHRKNIQAWDLFLDILKQRDEHVAKFWEQD